MRRLALVTISLSGVIALLDVAASFALNGSVDVPFAIVLFVAVAFLVQLTSRQPDPRDVVTLLRLRQRADALRRHVLVVSGYIRQPVDSSTQDGPSLRLDHLLDLW